MDRKQMMDALHQHKIVAILRGVPGAKVVKTAQALAEGGNPKFYPAALCTTAR